VFIEAKDDGGDGDNWTTGAISCANTYQLKLTIHKRGPNKQQYN